MTYLSTPQLPTRYGPSTLTEVIGPCGDLTTSVVRVLKAAEGILTNTGGEGNGGYIHVH